MFCFGGLIVPLSLAKDTDAWPSDNMMSYTHPIVYVVWEDTPTKVALINMHIYMYMYMYLIRANYGGAHFLLHLRCGSAGLLFPVT